MRVIVPNGVALGELATRLAADGTGEVKAEYREMFVKAQNDARRQMHEPLPPADYEMSAALAEGARQCVAVIDAVWDAMHP